MTALVLVSPVLIMPGSAQTPSAQCFVEANGDTVTDYEGNGGSLRLAIEAASAGDTLRVAGTCAATVSPDDNALIEIDTNLSLIGGYSLVNGIPDWAALPDVGNDTIVDAFSTGRVVRINSGLTVVLENLTIQNGNTGTSGGGVLNIDSDLTLRNVTLRANTASDAGGGLYSGRDPDDSDGFGSGGVIAGSIGSATGIPHVTILNSLLANNSAVDGGGLYSVHELDIIGTTIAGNTVSEGGGGAMLFAGHHIANTTIYGNRADGAGGGLWV